MEWDALPERARFVELKIVCTRHPKVTLLRQGLSTVADPRWSGRTWVMGNRGRFEQWAPHYLDVAEGTEMAQKMVARCSAPYCAENPQFRTDELHAILRLVSQEVSSDGSWEVPSRVVEELVTSVRRGKAAIVQETFASPLVRRVRGERSPGKV